MNTPPSPQDVLWAQQQALVQTLWQQKAGRAKDIGGDASFLIAAIAHQSIDEALKNYKSNATALAERALSAAHPVLTQLMSAESMAHLARALWHNHPPHCGDVNRWGAALADFMAASDQLRDHPWLADVARLEWALHQAESAADPTDPPQSADALLHLLGQHDPAQLHLQWAAGASLLGLHWQGVAQVVSAHQTGSPDWETPQRPMSDADPPMHQEWVWIWRPHWKPRHQVVEAATARFMQAQLQGSSLLQALDEHPIDFAHWLPQALQAGWLRGVRCVAS